MMLDRLGHGRVMPVGYAKFLGGLLHNPGQRRIVSVANKRAQVMHDMVIQSAHEPTNERVRGRVVGRGCENVIDPVVELVAAGREVSAVDAVCGLEYERDA